MKYLVYKAHFEKEAFAYGELIGIYPDRKSALEYAKQNGSTYINAAIYDGETRIQETTIWAEPMLAGRDGLFRWRMQSAYRHILESERQYRLDHPTWQVCN